MDPVTLEELERLLDGGEAGRRQAAALLGNNFRIQWGDVTAALVFDPEGPTLDQLWEDADGPA